MSMPELPMDDDERQPFVSDLDRVRVPKLIGRDGAPSSRLPFEES